MSSIPSFSPAFVSMFFSFFFFLSMYTIVSTGKLPLTSTAAASRASFTSWRAQNSKTGSRQFPCYKAVPSSGLDLSNWGILEKGLSYESKDFKRKKLLKKSLVLDCTDVVPSDMCSDILQEGVRAMFPVPLLGKWRANSGVHHRAFPRQRRCNGSSELWSVSTTGLRIKQENAVFSGRKYESTDLFQSYQLFATPSIVSIQYNLTDHKGARCTLPELYLAFALNCFARLGKWCLKPRLALSVQRYCTL